MHSKIGWIRCHTYFNNNHFLTSCRVTDGGTYTPGAFVCLAASGTVVAEALVTFLAMFQGFSDESPSYWELSLS